MSKIKYIILDFDGTIADTIGLALNIYNRIAPEYKCNPVKEEDRGMLRAKRPQDLLKEYGVSNLKLISILLRIRKEMINLIPEIKLINGIKDSLKEIINSGLRAGILTSNSRKNVNSFLEKNNLSDLIDFVYSGKSLFGKDRVLMHLLHQENISGEEVIYVGDETRDIEASKRAGIPVIAVSWGLNCREILESLNPDQIADTPEDLYRCVQQIINKHINRINNF